MTDPGLPGAPRSRHFALFDSLRALAVLAVVVIHVGAFTSTNNTAWYGIATSQGRIGVTIFFVISGFLLFRPHALASLGGGSAVRLQTYAWRRFLRIVPAYWVALTLLALWPGLPGVFTADGWIYYGMLQAYDFRWLFNGIPPAWSLSVEVAFYAALPLLAWGLSKLGRDAGPRVRLRKQIAALALLTVATEAFRLCVWSAGWLNLLVTLPVFFLAFAVGMSLALGSVWVGCDERRWRWTGWVVDRPGACWTLALAVFLAGCLSPAFITPRGEHSSALSFGLEQILYVAIAALLLLPAVFGEDAGGWPRRVLASRPMCWLGRISYGVFLWHHPLLSELAKRGVPEWIPGWPFLSLTVAGLPVAVLFGWASFHLVERPAMRLRRRFDP